LSDFLSPKLNKTIASIMNPIKALSIIGISTIVSISAQAIPNLQLDIQGGTYDPVSQTVIASGNPFTLYALFDASKGAIPTGNYFISAAIIPQTSVPTFGSFKVDSTTYSAGSGMQYGNPPVSAAFPNLPSHGIFPTYYAEISFSFNAANKATEYNTQDSPGGLVLDPTGTLLYQSFSINIGNVPIGYKVHFDLYDELLKLHPEGATDLDFAPFSHDAQSGAGGGGGGSGPPPTPDGGTTVALLGLAVAGIGMLRRKLA
jgi:hypothetical protein